MEDTYLHKGLRKKLVEEIKSKGIRDQAVLDAVGNVPRHLFMDSSFTKFAYKDQAFPIGSGQTISQPYTVAFQTELLKVKSGDRILEIGTGSGYQAAILIEMGAKVYTIERIKKLMTKAKALLPSLGYNPHFFYGDGYSGLPTYAKFDKILITAAAPEIPIKLIDQLKTGGRMVLPIGSSYSQVMTLVVKTGENDYKETGHGYFVFVPMLKGKN
jgi:protein-L-isoaspartate(D-aspartate) O-methyltransferase